MADYTLSAKITADITGFSKSLKTAQDKLSAFSSAVSGIGSSMKNIGGSLTGAGTKLAALETAAFGAAGAVGVKCVQAGASFEAEMTKVQAISGANQTEMEQLTEKAKEMGEKTKFSASESAQAFEYMAMAGWETGDMLDGIEGIMNLAAASGEDLASTSDIVTDALTAFGLSAEDSGHFADVLAKASSSANTNVGMMGETFKYVAPVAGALGYSAEDVATAVGLMANSGIKASQAGTSLRAVLSRLAKPTEEVQAAMDYLGVSLTDSNGDMYSFMDVMQQMRTGFAGLTTDQKATYAAALGGQEAMSGLLAIVNASDSDFSKLADEINNCEGTCQSMADTMNSSLSGQFTILKSQIEGIEIKVFEQLEPALSNIVSKAQECATAVSNMLTAFFEAKEAGGTLNGLQAAIGALSGMSNTGISIAGALGSVAEKAQLILDKFQELKAAGVPFDKIAAGAAALAPALLLGGKATSLLGGGLSGISSIASGLGGIFGKISGGVKDLSGLAASVGGVAAKYGTLLKTIEKESLATSGEIGSVAAQSGKSLNDIAKESGKTVNQLRSDAMKAADAYKKSGMSQSEAMKKAYADIGYNSQKVTESINSSNSRKGLFGGIESGLESLKTELSKLTSWMPESVSNAFSGVLSAGTNFGSKFTSILMKAFGFGAIGGLVLAGLGLIQQNFGDKIFEILTMVQEKGPQIITDFCAGITEKIPELIAQGGVLINSLLTTLNTLMPSILSGGADIILSLVNGFALQLPFLLSQAGNLIITIIQGLTEKLPDILAAGMRVIQSLVAGISSFLPELIPAAVDMVLELVMGLVDQLPALIDSGIQLVTALVDGLLNAIPKIVEKAPEIIGSLVGTLLTKAPELIVTAGKLILKLANGLIQAIPKLVAKIPEIIGAIKDKFLDTDWGQLGKDIMGLVVDGLKTIVNLAITGLNNLIEGLNLIPGVDIPEIPYLANGTDNFAGGFARINEGGRGELVSLPNGTQVIPHDISKRYAREAARANAGYAVEIDYNAIGEAVAAAMGDVNMHATFEVDGKTMGDVVTPFVDRNLGRRAALANRYTR